MNVGAESFSYSSYSRWVEFITQLGEVPFETVSNEHISIFHTSVRLDIMSKQEFVYVFLVAEF